MTYADFQQTFALSMASNLVMDTSGNSVTLQQLLSARIAALLPGAARAVGGGGGGRRHPPPHGDAGGGDPSDGLSQVAPGRDASRKHDGYR